MLLSDTDLTNFCVGRLRDLELDDLAQKVTVVWNSRMRTTAGRAFWPEAKIELNEKLPSMGMEEVKRTLLHELAHLVAYSGCGRRRIAPHGVEWQQACADLGIPGERVTHSMPFTGRKMAKKWSYHCGVCGEGFERVRRIKRLAGCYSCCKAHNGGYYDKRFRLVESSI